MKVQFMKLVGGATIPTKSHPSDSGWDLYAHIEQGVCLTRWADTAKGLYCDGSGHMTGLKEKPYGVPHLHLRPTETANIFCGVAVSPPPGWGYTVRGRSSLNLKGIHTLLGTVDSGFTGKLFAMLHNGSKEEYVVRHGDRVAQIVFEPVIPIELEEVTNFASEGRGNKAFGSSGR